jgi:hypothetical protein
MSASDEVTEASTRGAGLIWRRVVIALVVLVVLLFGAGFAWQWRAGSSDRLGEIVDRLDESDPGWRLVELEKEAQEDIPEARNSSVVISNAARLLPRSWPTSSFIFRFEGVNREPAVRLDDERAALLHREMAGLAAALAEARKLKAMSRGRHLFTSTFEIALHCMEINNVASLLRFDALDRAHRGQIDEALESCLAVLNLVRSIGAQPHLNAEGLRISGISRVCDTIERVLNQGQASEASLVALQELLSEEKKHHSLLICVRAQRALVDDQFTRMKNGPITVVSAFDGAPLPSRDLDLKTRLLGFWKSDFQREHVRSLELTTRMVEIARLPEHEQEAEERKLDAEIQELPSQAALTIKVLQWWQAMGRPARRKTAQVRSLLALVAVERYRLKHGKWPDRLEDLRPEFLTAVPLNPEDGRPLGYAKRGDGVTIVSPRSYRLWDVRARGISPERREE